MKNDHVEGHAYRLNFRCTNNMVEYEALLLGLKLIKGLGATKVSILGDSDVIIQQMKGNFVTNDLRLRAYRGASIEILDTFSESQLTKIPRKHNLHAHSLATFASTCKLPFEPNHSFTAEIKHRPVVPDNVKNWKIFENDTQINNFLTLKEEFSNMNIDTSTMDDQQQTNKTEQNLMFYFIFITQKFIIKFRGVNFLSLCIFLSFVFYRHARKHALILHKKTDRSAF